MIKNKTFKKAFTMAEAILVMTILGIIATIMITTLKPAEFKEKGLTILAVKVLSEIDTATTQIIGNNTKLGSMTTLIKADGTKFAFSENGEEVLKLYKKYLVTTRAEIPSTSYCYDTDAATTAKNAAYLKDGACMKIAAGAVATAVDTIFPEEDGVKQVTATQGLIYFDTNGEEEPNTVGKDRFIIPINDEGIQY